MTDRTDNSSRDEGSSSPRRNRQRAGEPTDLKTAFADAQEAVVDAARDVGDQAKQAAQTAREKAEELADQGKSEGADHMASFARVARGAADDLEEQSPEVASYVRQAADGLDQAASSVRNRSIGEFVDMAGDFARRQPTAFFATTVLAGFVLSRFIKSGASRSANGQRSRGRGNQADGHGEPTPASGDAAPQGMPSMGGSAGEMPS